MPVSVSTSLLSAVLAAGLLAVFPTIAGSDESDEVGSYGDLTGENSQPDRVPTPKPAPTAPPRFIVKPRPPRPATPPRPTPAPRPAFQHKPVIERTVKPPLENTNTPNLDRPHIPQQPKSPSAYTRRVRNMIRAHNKKGQVVGDIKLFAKENRWGASVKIQNCYGDNILTRFSVTDKGVAQKLWFQFKNVTYRNRGRHRHRWIMVEPGFVIRGRKILLRAQASKGNAILSLKVLGSCIERSRE